MKWRPDSLWGRLSLLLLGVLLLAQMLSAAIHLRDRGEALEHATGFNSAQRIAGLVDLLDPLPPKQRKNIVDALDLPPLRLRLQAKPQSFPSTGDETARSKLLHQFLHFRLGHERRILVHVPREQSSSVEEFGSDSAGLAEMPMMRRMMGHRFGMMGSMTGSNFSFVVQVALQGGQWAVFSYHLPAELASWPWDLLIALVMLFATVVFVSFFAVRLLMRPLSELAAAADELGKDIRRPPLAETGPIEVRRAARAFNTMQRRLGRFVEERTRILAAVSHDLKTPITRLRLRLEKIDDAGLRQKFEVDLDEMQKLIQGSLDVMRGMALQETTRPLDINALLESLRDDAEDMGKKVTVSGEALTPYRGKPLALKRCLVNLIDNAVRYGGGAAIEILDTESELRIDVVDRGPGIPEDALNRVFEPFFRLEASRNSATGGTGLGLSIARNIARAHGGELSIENIPKQGGLRATLLLPR